MDDPESKKRTRNDDSSFPTKERKQPLPWSAPKSREEDPEAPERVRRILENPSYRRADQDLDLLKRDELRPTRLELEFLKPELILEEHGIRGTIVVFGVPPEHLNLPVKMYDIYRREISVVGSFTNPYTNEQALRLMATGRIKYDQILTHSISLNQVEDAILKMRDRTETVIKAQIQF